MRYIKLYEDNNNNIIDTVKDIMTEFNDEYNIDENIDKENRVYYDDDKYGPMPYSSNMKKLFTSIIKKSNSEDIKLRIKLCEFSTGACKVVYSLKELDFFDSLFGKEVSTEIIFYKTI